MQFEYSTIGVEPKRRVEYWSDVVARHFIPANVWLGPTGESDLSWRGHTLGSLKVAECHAPVRTWDRTEQHVRIRPEDDLLVTHIVTGTGHMTHAGRELQLLPGDTAIYDANAPFRQEMTGTAIAVRIPKALLIPRVPLELAALNSKLGATGQMGGLIASMIREASGSMSSASEAAKSRYASGMLDILAATLEMQFSDTAYEAGDTESLFLKAKCFVNANLDDYRLTTQYIADALGISRRTLARAFAKHDATLMHYIWSRRLEVSHALLAEGKVKQITDAAIQTGFCDLSHYSRAFKKKYGVSPSEIFSKIG